MISSPYCEICGAVIPNKKGATKFCSEKCRKQALEDSIAVARTNKKKNAIYKEQYDHAIASQLKLTEDAVEARQKKLSYGKLMARRNSHA